MELYVREALRLVTREIREFLASSRFVIHEETVNFTHNSRQEANMGMAINSQSQGPKSECLCHSPTF